MWSIYFNGMVDPRDEAEGMREIKAALKAYNPGICFAFLALFNSYSSE